jgi:hypothetical protein
MEHLRTLFSALTLIFMAPALWAMQGVSQEEINHAATAYSMSISGEYSMNAEGEASAVFYEQLTKAGAIRDDQTLDPEFAEAYSRLGDRAEGLFSQLCKAYQFSATEESPSAEGLLAVIKALEFGAEFNKGIARSRDKKDGIYWGKTNKFVRSLVKEVVVSRAGDFLDAIADAKGKLLVFNNKVINTLYRSKERTPQVGSIVDLVEDTKVDRNIRVSPSNRFRTQFFLQKVARDSGLQLHSVIPGKVVSHYDEQDLAEVIMSALVVHASKLEGAVYLLAFNGPSKYQFFTVSLYEGYINITFAADDSNPVPVVVATMPINRVNYDRLYSSIERFMEGRQKVPKLTGIWIIANQ